MSSNETKPATAAPEPIDAKVRRDLDIARAELENQSTGAKEKVEGVSLQEIADGFSGALSSLSSGIGAFFSAKPSDTAMDAWVEMEL